jgi:hypothetical protein
MKSVQALMINGTQFRSPSLGEMKALMNGNQPLLMGERLVDWMMLNIQVLNLPE